MFDKLKSLMEGKPEREFKPREQGLKRHTQQITTEPGSEQSDSASLRSSALPEKSVNLGHDQMNKKLDASRQERMNSKMLLLQQLRKELQNGKT